MTQRRGSARPLRRRVRTSGGEAHSIRRSPIKPHEHFTAGIADELIAARRRTMAANLFINGRRALRFAFGEVANVTDSPYPFTLLVSQVDTERVLEKRVASLGSHVERPLEPLGFEQDVRARLRHGDGREEALRARYVVGCDGAHSVVRQEAAPSFDGAAYPAGFRARGPKRGVGG